MGKINPIIQKELDKYINELIDDCIENFERNYTNDVIEDPESYITFNIQIFAMSLDYMTKNFCDKVIELYGESVIQRRFGDLYNMISRVIVNYDWENRRFLTMVQQFIDDVNYIGYELDNRSIQGKLNKALRGRFVGGGFGVSGALKGMVTASILNGITGIGYSIMNTFGDACRLYNAKRKIMESVLNKPHRDALSDALDKSLQGFFGIAEFIMKEI